MATEKQREFYDQVRDFFRSYDEGDVDHKMIATLNRIAREEFKGKVEGDARKVVPYHIGMEAYCYILENGGSANEAMEYAVTQHNMSIESLKSMANNNNYYHAKNIVIEHDNHTQQQRMLKEGTMDRIALKSSSSFNQQLRRLSQQKNVHDRLTILEEIANHHEQRIEQNEREISILKNEGNRFPIYPKETARLLYKQGATQKQVADEVGKSTRTIKRWWKEFKEDYE